MLQLNSENMPRLLFLLIMLSFSLASYSQKDQVADCAPIIFSDSLFQLQSDDYDFAILVGNIVRNIKKHSIKDINDIVTLEGNCLIFRISYACGCGSDERRLVTNEKLQQDDQSRNYYELKFLFNNHNNGCETLCHDKLSFDLSE